MRSLLIIFAVLAVCYILLLGIPQSPGEIQFIKFFQAMKIEISDLIDHFSLMQHPWVKVTIIAGAALIFTGFVRQVAR
jgi:hypothetical protein